MIALLLACTSEPAIDAAPVGKVAEHAGMDGWVRASVDPVEGEVVGYIGYSVRPVSLQVFEGYRVSAALWLPAGEVHGGVLMAHGHFGQGKSSGEAQGPAHLFARNGYAVLAVDTPGVEEGARPDRAIHFDEGAANRALLWSHDSSAMAVQLHGLQAGLDYLQGYSEELVVAGSSGGAVQALYLLFVDPRPKAAVLASMVPVPREARASGCACDVLPGWEGPDPSLVAAIPKPVLWMTEVAGSGAPTGLPRTGSYEVHPGGHGFEADMQRSALAFLHEHLGGNQHFVEVAHTPEAALASKGVGTVGLAELAAGLPGTRQVTAGTAPGLTLACTGEGPRVLTLGADEGDKAALVGFEQCAVDLQADPLGPTVGLVLNTSYAMGMAEAVATAGGPIYAVGPWAVVAALSGQVYVARDPMGAPDHSAPAWAVHPGLDPTYPTALAVGSDPAVLALALLDQ